MRNAYTCDKSVEASLRLEQGPPAVRDFLRRTFQHLNRTAEAVNKKSDSLVGRDIAILEARRAVYKRANRANPERWTGKVRSWRRPVKVRLHPDRRQAGHRAKVYKGAPLRVIVR